MDRAKIEQCLFAVIYTSTQCSSAVRSINSGHEQVKHPVFQINYDGDDTTPDRLHARAAELGISPEQFIKRAIAEHLGAYGIKTPADGFEAGSLREFFEAHGLLHEPPRD